MKKKSLLLILLMALIAPWAAKAQETHTVYDGTTATLTSSGYVPMYSGYFDEYTKSEFVIPASKLEIMTGGTISSLKFYIETVSSWGDGSWNNTHQIVFLKEIEATTLSDYSGQDGATIVFDGTFTKPGSTDTEFDINFTTDYEYQGGNLLIGIYNTAKGKYHTVTWKGESATGASGGSSKSSSLSDITFTQRNFIPKTTFTYEMPSTGCDKPETLVANPVTAHEATLTWAGGSGTYNVEIKGGTYTDWTTKLSNTTLTTTTINNLDAETAYQVRVQSVCPGDIVSQWKSESFNTPIACPAPTELIVAIIPGQGTKATFSWTNGDEESSWQLCLNGDEEHLIDMDTNPFTYTSFTPETAYTAKVRAYCNDIDQSTWSNTVNFTPTDSYTITLNDVNTTTNSYIPIYGSYVDYGNRSQFIIPASSLSELQWASIEKLTLYANQTSTTFTNDVFSVYMTEVPYTTFASNTFENWDNMQTVYSGSVAISDKKMEITFDTPYTYSGGNLLIGFHQTAYNTTVSCTWVGTSQTGNTALYQTANSGHSWTGTITTQTFTPKITIKYVPGEEPDCLPVSNLSYDPESITPHTVALNWNTGNSGETAWKLQYRKQTEENFTTYPDAITAKPFTLPNLSASTTYIWKVAAWCDPANADAISEYVSGPSFLTGCEDITTFPWNEPFEGFTENTVPLCWDNTESTSTDATNNPHYIWGVYKHSSSNNKMMRMYNSLAHTGTALINTNNIVLPSEGEYELTFDYSHRASCGAFLVKVSTDGGTTFTQIGSYTSTGTTDSSNPGTFTEATISLADYAGQTIILQFFANANYGSGAIFVDNVSVHVAPTCKKPSGLAKDATTAHTATLHWTNGSTDQNAWQIAYSTSSTFAPDDSFTPGENEGLVDVTTNPATISGLAKGTTYYAYVRADCGSTDYSYWCSTKVSFTTTSGVEYPTNLSVIASSITSNQAQVKWKGVAANDLHESYDVYYSRLSTRPTPLEADSLFNVTDTTYLFPGLDPETKYYVWVRDVCGVDGTSLWTTSSVNFTTASACQTPDGVNAIEVTQTTAKISWNTYGLTTFNLRYKQKDAADWNETITNITCPYTISTNLEPNTEYLVQVQGTCADAETWSASGSFTTECGPISVASEAYFYDFETTLKFNCWNVLTGTSSIQEVTSQSYTSYYHSATHYLRFIGTTSNVIVLPQFVEETNTLQISFWHRPESNSAPISTNNYSGKFAVGYMTDTADVNTFHAIETFVATDWTAPLAHKQFTCYLDSAPNGAYIAFRQYDCQYNYYWFVDDVEVSVAPLCRPVKNLAYSNVTNHSATITWTKGTEDQDTWQLKYNKDEDFDPDEAGELVDNIINTTYTFNKTLEAAKVYYIYVRANCGGSNGNSPWTKTVISTEASAPYPTTFAKTEVGPDWVDLYWNAPAGDYLSGYGIYYATTSTEPTAETPASVTINDPTAPTSEAPYRLTGLTSETTYYIWVRANHETDVYSSWKAITGTSFTTLVACPTPTSLAANNITQNTANLTWTGYSNSYTVEKRTAETTGAELFFEGFESGIPATWTTIDSDGDGNNWMSLDEIPTKYTSYTQVPGWSRTGDNAAASPSYANSVGCFDSDHWLITPQLDLGGMLKFYIMSTYDDLDSYEVLLSTTGVETTDFTVTLQSMTDATYGSWDEVTINLSTYAGQQGYIAIHHVSDCMYFLIVDDFGIYEYSPAGGWAEATTTATDGAYTLEGLTADTKYDVRVKGNCGGEYSAVCSFTTLKDNEIVFPENGNWTAANFKPTGAPTTADDVVIRANVTITGGTNAAANNINIENGSVITVANGATLTIAGDIPVGGAANLIIEDGGQVILTQDDWGVLATVKKSVAHGSKDVDNWYTISSPLYNATDIDDVTNLVQDPKENYDLYQYNEETMTWENSKDTEHSGGFDELVKGRGYLYWNNSGAELSFPGFIHNEPVDYDLTTGGTGDLRGFNLIGNPFSHNITKGDAGCAILNTNGTYVLAEGFYRLSDDGAWDPELDQLADGTIIKPGEGILVKATTAGTITMTSTPVGAAKANNDFLKFIVANSQHEDATFALFKDGIGLTKIDHRNANIPMIYIPQDGQNYAIATMNDNTEMFGLNVKAMTTGKYTLKTKANGDFSYLHIIDRLTGDDVDMLLEGEYSFIASPQDTDARFIVKLRYNANSTVTSGDIFAYQNGDDIIVSGEGELQIFDVMGRMIATQHINGTETVNVNAIGVYIFKLNEKTQKIVVR